MYDRAGRFHKSFSSTPDNVGPATYYFNEVFGKIPDLSERKSAFNSSQPRKISFTNKSLVENPSPNKYKICFRKIRIVGGTTMQNRAPRTKYKTLNVTRGPYPWSGPKKQPGKVHRGVPPRSQAATVSSVPERGACGYEITREVPVKIYHPPEDKPIGPATYYNPEGERNSTSVAYQGVFWSLRTAQRFQYEQGEGPGPAAYKPSAAKALSSLEQYQQRVRAHNSARAPLLRTNDALQRKLCAENLPGPAAYFPFDPNTQKCDCGKEGTFSKAQRQDLYLKSEGPGPAAYVDPRSALRPAHPPPSVRHPAPRFQTTTTSIPGPGEYSPRTSLWDEVKRRGHSKFAQSSAPFDSSAARTTTVTRRDSACTPAPDWYFPEFQKKGDKNKSSAFKSKSTRSITVCQKTPGPATYSTTGPFKALSEPNSHLKATTAAFLSSSARPGLVRESPSPAATTYNLPESLLATKGCKIGERWREKREELTPGPPDYTVHPKFAKSSLFNTFNVTLSPPKKRVCNKNKFNLVKKLRCFSLN